MTVENLNTNEYNLFYQTYIDACGNFKLVEGLINNLEKTLELFNSIPSEKHEYRYDDGKWTIKELIHHLIDSERVFAYRALRIAREDKTNLPGYGHNDYVPVSRANKRSYIDLIEEFEALRKSSISLFKSFDETMLQNVGTANNEIISVRAIGFIMVGHYNHHMNIIRERYL